MNLHLKRGCLRNKQLQQSGGKGGQQSGSGRVGQQSGGSSGGGMQDDGGEVARSGGSMGVQQQQASKGGEKGGFGGGARQQQGKGGEEGGSGSDALMQGGPSKHLASAEGLSSEEERAAAAELAKTTFSEGDRVEVRFCAQESLLARFRTKAKGSVVCLGVKSGFFPFFASR